MEDERVVPQGVALGVAFGSPTQASRPALQPIPMGGSAAFAASRRLERSCGPRAERAGKAAWPSEGEGLVLKRSK